MTPPESRFLIVPPSTLVKLLEMQPEAKLAWRGSLEHAKYALHMLEHGESLSNVPLSASDAAIMTVADFGSVFMSHTTIDEEVSVEATHTVEVDIEADDAPMSAAHSEIHTAVTKAWGVVARLEERLGIRPGGVRDLPNALYAIESAFIEFLSRKADVERDESEREYACSKLLSAIIEMGIKRADIPTTLRGRTKLVCELAESYFHTHGRVNDALKNARSVLDRGAWEKEPFDAQIHSLTSYAGHFKRAQELDNKYLTLQRLVETVSETLRETLRLFGWAGPIEMSFAELVKQVTVRGLEQDRRLKEQDPRLKEQGLQLKEQGQEIADLRKKHKELASHLDLGWTIVTQIERQLGIPLTKTSPDGQPLSDALLTIFHEVEKLQQTLVEEAQTSAQRLTAIDVLERKLNSDEQKTKCAECGNVKHTPWRGPKGYVCLKCVGDRYNRFEGAADQHFQLCELYTKCELALHPALDVLAPGVKYKHHIDAVNMVANAVTATQHLLIESIKKLGAADKTVDYSLQNMVSLLTKFAFDARAQRNKMADDFNKERTLCVKAMAETKAAASKVFDAESKMHKAQATLRPTQDELLTTQRRLRELERGVAEMLGIKYEPKERYDMEEVKRRFKARVHPLAGYDELARVLDAALEQAQSGKGKERHGMSGDRWVDQKIHTIPQSQGHVGGLVYQVSKKALECEFMVRQGQFAQAFKEALGVVVYAAALAWQTSIRVREHMFDDQKGVAKTVPIKQFVAIQGSPATLLTPKEHIHIQHAPEASIGGPTGNVKYAFEGVTPVPRHGAKFKRGDEVFINDGQFKGEHHKIRTAVLMGSNSKPLSWFYRMEGLGAVEIPEEHLEETPSSDIDDSSSHDGE